MTKLKLIFASTALLIAGTAFANPSNDADKAARRDARIEKRFAMLDSNKDGVVTLDEMKANAGKNKGHKHHGKHRFGHKRHGQQVK